MRNIDNFVAVVIIIIIIIIIISIVVVDVRFVRALSRSICRILRFFLTKAGMTMVYEATDRTNITHIHVLENVEGKFRNKFC